LCDETNPDLLFFKDNPKAWATLVANVNANYIHNSDTKTSFSMESFLVFVPELQKNLKDKYIFERYLNGNN